MFSAFTNVSSHIWFLGEKKKKKKKRAKIPFGTKIIYFFIYFVIYFCELFLNVMLNVNIIFDFF